MTHFNPKENPWYSFMVQVKWTIVILNADKRITSVENFQGSYGESKPKHPVLWQSDRFSYVFKYDYLKGWNFNV